MKFQGTRGEWKVKHSATKSAFNVVGTVLGGRYKIARVPYSLELDLPAGLNDREMAEAEANAKLIACAPQMLEFLNTIVHSESTPIAHRIAANNLIIKATT